MYIDTEWLQKFSDSGGIVMQKKNHIIKNTVLVVDDEELLKKSLRDVLNEDYEVMEASNGQEALDVLKEHYKEISVIVLDLVMPVMDGVSFLKQFNKHDKYKNIPVIVATSSEEEELEHQCLENGVWDFVMKPYNPVLLKFRIRNAIEKSRMIMTERDPITGIYTKMKFYQEVRNMLNEVSGETFAFVRFDIDRFKMINNFYGLREGDKVLQTIANELVRISGVFDHFVYGHLENDVFACCLPYKEENIDLLVNALHIKLKKANKDYNIKLSYGVYIITDYSMDISEMYDRAFLAAKSCKGKFVENVVYYDESMIENMRQEQYIINEVNRALEEEQFEVFFQPKINLITDKPFGAEALVRWRHPEKGMISPADFIPIYERNGIIGRLDQYMWRHVCKLLRKWLDEGKSPDPISVNVSRVNIYNPHLVDILKNLVTEYKIPPHYLNLELTESAFTEDQGLVMRTMSKLHSLGFKIMMDDFGSGYSSLNVLKDMEVDYLKVDMKFLQDEEFNGRGEKVLTSVIRMAKWLHLPSIVEGVETKEQVDFLKCIGCEYAQGFYYAKPMPVEEYEHYMEKDHQNEPSMVVNESTEIINQLWDTRSAASMVFDNIQVPVALFEYRNDKAELLRSNCEYDFVFQSQDSILSEKRQNVLRQEREVFNKAFKEAVENVSVCIPQYQYENGEWYKVLVKYLGKRDETYIMMVTFIDISEYVE